MTANPELLVETDELLAARERPIVLLRRRAVRRSHNRSLANTVARRDAAVHAAPPSALRRLRRCVSC